MLEVYVDFKNECEWGLWWAKNTLVWSSWWSWNHLCDVCGELETIQSIDYGKFIKTSSDYDLGEKI